MGTKEIIQSTVVGYSDEKHAVEIKEIEFQNGHKVKYVSSSKQNYPKDKEVFVYLAGGVLPTFTIKKMEMETKDLTRSIWGVEDGEVLSPISLSNRSDINNGILIETSSDDEDGTYPLVMNYVTFANKIDKEGASAWLNRISNSLIIKNRLDIEFGICRIIRENEYDSKAKLIFKEPIEVLFGMIGDKQIIQKVSEIQGEFTYDWFWIKNGRQNKIANGFEIWFNIEKYLK